MAPVKLKYIVSFTSQDDCHKANNLITGGGIKKWLCHPKDRSGKIEIVIQLEEATQFSFIDIGTLWCASLEVRVGKSDWPQTTEYKTLVPMVNLMSPIDCQLGRKITSTQMFTSKDFSNTVVGQKWDRIQVICRQPFRKDMALGMSFLRIRNSGQVSSNSNDDNSIEKKSPQGKKISDIKRHFFGDSKENKGLDEDLLKQRLLQISSSSDNGCENLHEESLSRTAQLVLKASEQGNKSRAHYAVQSDQSKRGLFSDTKTNKTGLTLDEEMAAFLPTLNLSMVDFDTVTIADLRHKFERKKRRKLSTQERRKFSEQCQSFMWQLSENGFSENQNSSTNTRLPSAGAVETSTSSPVSVSSSKKTGRGHDETNESNPAFRSPSSMKTCSKSSTKSRPNTKMSPAAIIRARNNALENDIIEANKSNSKDSKHRSKSIKNRSKKRNSSSDSEDSDSDICYNSSHNEEDDSDRDSIKIDDSSPNSKIRIKRKLQTLDDVNKSYKDLYNTFSTPDISDQDGSRSYSSVKRKKLNSNNKKLLEVFDSELSGGETESVSAIRDPSSSNSNTWLRATKDAGAVTPKAAKHKKSITPCARKKNNNPSASKSLPSIKNNKVSLSAKKSSSVAIKETTTPDATRLESFKTFNWPSKSSASQKKSNDEQGALLKHILRKVNSGSSSMLCKSCGFLIPQDTYAAHCSTCISPANTDKKTTNLNSRNSGNVRVTEKPTNLTTAGARSDFVDLTQISFQQCPICLKKFPQEVLMAHASECGL